MLKHIKSRHEADEQLSLGAKGFTLIELLVVIVILGILAAVVVFAVSGITDKGKVSACQTQAKTIRTAFEAYDAQWSAYPTSIGQLYQSTGTQQNFLNGDFTSDNSNLVKVTSWGTGTSSPTIAWDTKCSAPNLSASEVTALGNP